MDKKQKEELIRLVGERVRFDCLMAQYTTFGVGGHVEALYEASDLEGLRQVVVYLNKEHIPYLVVGRGSNLLVKDGGLEGVVILLRESLAFRPAKPTQTDTQENDLTILTGAGLPIVDLLIYCRDSGLGGLEFLAGIPGTVGGAVVMNAGAFGREIESKIKEIYVITSQGDLIIRDRSQLNFSYRGLEIEEGSVIIRVCFQLEQETEEVVAERIAGYLKKRKENQPLEFSSAGSVFRNPPNDYAGKLIENAGLKGKRIGGAMISKKHANFIINTGDAKAEDIISLLYLAQNKVLEETGIELQPEIQVVGR